MISVIAITITLQLPCAAHQARRDEAGVVRIGCAGQAPLIAIDRESCPIARVQNDGTGRLTITCRQR